MENTNMEKGIYHEYAALDAQIKVLIDRKDGLREVITKDIIKSKEEKVPLSFGIFSLTHTPKYTYSKKVDKLDQDLKLQKLKERQRGTAKAKITVSMQFRGV